MRISDWCSDVCSSVLCECLCKRALRGAEIVVLPLCGRQLVGIHQAARRLRHDHELRPARAQRGCESPQLGHALGARLKMRAEIRFGSEQPAVATLLQTAEAFTVRNTGNFPGLRGP